MTQKFAATLLGTAIAFSATTLQAQLYINEILFNVGGGGSDLRDEYIELRGTPGMPLANHYLIFVENESLEDGSGPAGEIDNLFDLGAYSMGSNGFLTIRQKGTRYSAPAAGTTNLVNASPPPTTGSDYSVGYGSNGFSSIGANDSLTGDDPAWGHLEGGGFTAMLIRADSWGPGMANAPVVPAISPIFDIDQGNDGLDPLGASHMNWRESWTILDAIGLHADDDGSETEHGRLYAQVNFGVQPGFLPPGWEPNIEPGAEFQLLPYELEYAGRWGNSTGQTTDDWHISNFTDRQNAGSLGVSAPGGPDWRQSCRDLPGCHPGNPGFPNSPPSQPSGGTESTKGVPYGTKLANTLGAPNYITGDFNKDGYVDAADYIVWRKMFGQTGFSETNHPAADADHNFMINAADYAKWTAFFGGPNNIGSGAGSGGSSSAPIPEPTTWLMAALAAIAVSAYRKGRA